MKNRLFNFKSLVFLLGLSWLSIDAFAQTQIGNSGFESWQNLGNSSERPTNFNNMKNGSLCTFCGIGSIQTSWRDVSTRPGSTGTYSVKVVTGSVVGNTVNGNITLGKLNAPTTTPADGYNATITGDANFSEAFTDRPDSLVVWAKYSITNSADSARISAILHDNYALRDPQDAGSAPHVVAKAIKNFQTGNSWVRISVPFNYTGPSSTVSYILLTFASSYAPGAGVDGASLYLDDLEMIYNPKVAIAPLANQNLLEGQAGTLLTATETFGTATSRAWKYSTTAGGPYTNTIAGQTGLTYTPQFLTAGTYYVVCQSTFGTYVAKSNEVKVVVTALANSIAPTAVQNLVTNQSGNVLTVTETPAASSRVWKYTTTSGSGYTGFVTAQTATTYTPNFATAGTYFVVCQSTLYGVTKTSNEVKVVVTTFTNSIAPTAIQNLVENQTGNTLTVTESATASSREWKFSTTSGSGYGSFVSAQTGTTYTPQFATAGTYYVVCESTLAGNTATSNEVRINVTVAVSNAVSISPNSIQNLIETQVGTTITASETPAAADSREWKWSITSGSGYASFTTAETGTTYAPVFATAGTYYVVCISDFAGDIKTSNEVQINVSAFSNSIAPTATQNLLETEVGTLLTVTETPTATSREWKFSTTSGSGYGSFVSAQTGTTYTPLFATAGTYYVVCKSTLSGITKTSNEVQINVTVAGANTVTIAPNTTQNLYEAQAGTQLTVTENPVADSREWKFSTTSGSSYGSFSPIEPGMNYTPQFATAGTYYVICEADFGGTMVTSNEVTVIVTVDVTGINENTNPSFAVYSVDNSLKVDLSNTDMKDATIEVLSIDGKVIAKQALTSNQMNTMNVTVPTGVYFFAISNGSQFFQGKVFIK